MHANRYVWTLILADWASLRFAMADDVNEWQLRRLFEPTRAERQAERAGQIMIYEALTFSDVQRALDAEFDRIESMMFIRTRQPVPEDPAAYLVEDDGCD